MDILLDESVSLSLRARLQKRGWRVHAVALQHKGITDEEVFRFARDHHAILITRDHHFTNPFRFPPQDVGAIVFIRHGNMTSAEEVSLVERFFDSYPFEQYQNRLVTLLQSSIRIR